MLQSSLRHSSGFSLWQPAFKPGSGHVGLVVGHSGAGAGFHQALRFPLPIFISPIAPQSPSSIIWHEVHLVSSHEECYSLLECEPEDGG
jgi:hypothetical protein